MTFPARSTIAALSGSLVLAAAVAGCGGSSSSSSSTAASTGTVASTSSPTGTSHTQSTRAGRGGGGGAGAGGGGGGGGASSTGSGSAGNRSTSHESAGPKLHATVFHAGTKSRKTAPLAVKSPGQNPCTFVTRGEAQASLGAPVSRMIDAPLGPTCVLDLKGKKQSVTLAVQAIDVRNYVAQMKKPPRHLTIGGHTAYCGTLGDPLLFVQLGGRRVLRVSAPCAAAEALAAKALGRIKA